MKGVITCFIVLILLLNVQFQLFLDFGLNVTYFAVPEHPAFYPAEQTPAPLRPENMQHRVESSLSNVFNNGGSSLDANMHSMVDMSAHGNRINGPPSMLSTQNSNFGLIQGINGGIKSAPGYSSSPYMFGADRNVLEARPTVGDASASLFTNVESNAHSMDEAAMGPDTSSFGFLGQIPRNFSLSDLTAHFSLSSGMSSLLSVWIHVCLSMHACHCYRLHCTYLMVMNKMPFRFCFLLIVFIPIF